MSYPLLSMCGRYSLEAKTKDLLEAFALAESIDYTPRYNIAPTQQVPIVRLEKSSGRHRCDAVRWGLSPAWAGRMLINARSETVASKPTFRDSFATRRCLVPATGFFEWQRLGVAKQPFHIQLADRSLFAFAGIWDHTVVDGAPAEGFVILTTRPNGVMKPIHDRMPVIIRSDAWTSWLGSDTPGRSDPFDPIADSDLVAYPVGTRVNNAANDEPSCVAAMNPDAATNRDAGDSTLWDL